MTAEPDRLDARVKNFEAMAQQASPEDHARLRRTIETIERVRQTVLRTRQIVERSSEYVARSAKAKRNA